MYLEVIGFIGFIILALLFFAESKKPVLGLAASVILFILGYWIYTDNIQIQTGETALVTSQLTENSTEARTESVSGNTTTITATVALSGNNTENTTTTKTYINIPATAVTPLNEFLGLIFIILSIFGMFNYTLVMVKEGI